jgi:hypothetical protein
MKQKLIISDNFYDNPHQYHRSFFEEKCLITEETVNNISSLLGNQIKIITAFNNILLNQDSTNAITANIMSDWIAVIYLTLPPNCVNKFGVNFYIHSKTKLDSYPNEYVRELHGWKSEKDLELSFNTQNQNDWIKYSSPYVKYNRIIIFSADMWHSYGDGFGTSKEDGLFFQQILLKLAP